MTPIILLGDVSLSSLDKLNQLLFAQLFKKFVQKPKLLCSSNNFIVLKNIIGRYPIFTFSDTPQLTPKSSREKRYSLVLHSSHNTSPSRSPSSKSSRVPTSYSSHEGNRSCSNGEERLFENSSPSGGRDFQRNSLSREANGHPSIRSLFQKMTNHSSGNNNGAFTPCQLYGSQKNTGSLILHTLQSLAPVKKFRENMGGIEIWTGPISI